MWSKDWTWEPPFSVGLRPPGSHWSTTGLVGFWDFREGAGTVAYDRSGNGNDGTLTNMDSATDRVATEKGRALDVLASSQQYADCGLADAYDYTTEDFSVRVICYPTDQSDAASGVISRGLYGADGWYLDLYYRGTAHWLPNAAGGASQGAQWAAPAGNQWLDIIAMRDGTTPRVFVNGAEVSYTEQPSLSDGTSSSRHLYIGTYGDPTHDSFSGLIALAAIYNRALSAAEVAGLYANPYIVYQPRPWRAWMASVAAEGLSIPVAMRYYRNRRVA